MHCRALTLGETMTCWLAMNVLTERYVQVSNFAVSKSSEQDVLMDKLVLLHERDLVQPPPQVSPGLIGSMAC